MLCARCGQETPDESVFCANCGFDLRELNVADGTATSPSDSANAPSGEALEVAAEESAEGEGEAPGSGFSAQPEVARDVSGDDAGADAHDEIAAEELGVSPDEPLGDSGSGDNQDNQDNQAELSDDGELGNSAPDYDAEPVDGDEGFVAVTELLEEGEYAPASHAVPGIYQSIEDEPLVDPPSGPEEPRLGRARVAIVAVVAALFGAAIVLLLCAVLLRVFGL